MAVESGTGTAKPRKPRHQKVRGEVCLNCETSINTRFCPHCGQENVHGDHSVTVLLRDFLTEIAYYDSKVWLTIRTMLTRPGRLSAEWAQGKRMKYVSPIKLYLWIAFIFFFAVAFRASAISNLNAAQPPNVSVIGSGLERDLSQVAGRHDWISGQVAMLKTEVQANRQRFLQTVREQIPRVMFVILPLYAFGLRLLYWRQRPYFVQHLVFVLHLQACYFLVLLLSLLLPPVASITSPVVAVIDGIVVGSLVTWMIVYTFLAIRTFYGQPRWLTSIKVAVIGAGYGALTVLGVLISVLIAINTFTVKKAPVAPAAPSPSKSE